MKKKSKILEWIFGWTQHRIRVEGEKENYKNFGKLIKIQIPPTRGKGIPDQCEKSN